MSSIRTDPLSGLIGSAGPGSFCAATVVAMPSDANVMAVAAIALLMVSGDVPG